MIRRLYDIKIKTVLDKTVLLSDDSDDYLTLLHSGGYYVSLKLEPDNVCVAAAKISYLKDGGVLSRGFINSDSVMEYPLWGYGFDKIESGFESLKSWSMTKYAKVGVNGLGKYYISDKGEFYLDETDDDGNLKRLEGYKLGLVKKRCLLLGSK